MVPKTVRACSHQSAGEQEHQRQAVAVMISQGRFFLRPRRHQATWFATHGLPAKEKIGHLADVEIPHMADATGGSPLYTGVRERDCKSFHEVI